MYATLGLVLATAVDPIILMPLVIATMFVVGVSAYAGVVRYAMRATTNQGMVQVFATFGLAIMIQGLAQYFFTPDFKSIQSSWLGGRTLNVGGVFLPWPQIYGGLISLLT